MLDETTRIEPTADDVVLDVRPLIEAGEEPFATIMETVTTLDGRSLLLIAPFEPTPLEGVLSSRGFAYVAQQIGEAEWRVRFTPGPDDVTPGTTPEPARQEPTTPNPPVAEPNPPVSPATIPRRTTTGASPAAAAMPVDPTQNVPPAWLPLGLLAAAGIGLMGFGIALFAVASRATVAPRHHDVVATVHLGVLAFLSTAVIGALHQFGPVVGARPLRSVRVGVVSGLAFVIGAWAIPIGFASGTLPIVQAGGVLATVAILAVAWNVSRALAAPDRGAPIVGLRLAVLFLVATAVFGVTYAFDLRSGWFVLLPRRVLAHAHLGLLGWLGLAYIAVAEKLWPMFLLAHRPSTRAGDLAVWFTGAGAPLLVMGLLWPSEPLGAAGAAIVLVGVGSHLASLASVIRHRRRKLELLHGFVLGSAACLVVAIVLAVALGLASMDVGQRSRLVTAEVLALMLWLALAVIGHAHKIVPFIAWNRLRTRGIMTGPDGRPLLFGHLVNDHLARATLVFAAAGAVLGLIGALSLTPSLLRAAAIALVLTAVLAMANLVSGPLLLIRRHAVSTGTESEGVSHAVAR